jgi:hypothetical protein
MTDHPKDGGPAFPLQSIGPDFKPGYHGMTLRAYAAIQLRQPDSGIDWLDDMIRNARRDDLAGRALAGAIANPNTPGEMIALDFRGAKDILADFAYAHADAMLAAREGKE